MNRVDKRSIMIWSLDDFQYYFIRMLVFGVIYYFFGEYGLVQKILLLFSIYFTITFIKEICINPLLYRNFMYLINDQMIHIYKGGLTSNHETIPIQRVQHVDISQSFYSRLFQLYSLTIYTAGLNHTIGYLPKEQAEQWKSYIIDLLVNKENKNDA